MAGTGSPLCWDRDNLLQFRRWLGINAQTVEVERAEVGTSPRECDASVGEKMEAEGKCGGRILVMDMQHFGGLLRPTQLAPPGFEDVMVDGSTMMSAPFARPLSNTSVAAHAELLYVLIATADNSGRGLVLPCSDAARLAASINAQLNDTRLLAGFARAFELKLRPRLAFSAESIRSWLQAYSVRVSQGCSLRLLCSSGEEGIAHNIRSTILWLATQSLDVIGCSSPSHSSLLTVRSLKPPIPLYRNEVHMPGMEIRRAQIRAWPPMPVALVVWRVAANEQCLHPSNYTQLQLFSWCALMRSAFGDCHDVVLGQGRLRLLPRPLPTRVATWAPSRRLYHFGRLPSAPLLYIALRRLHACEPISPWRLRSSRAHALFPGVVPSQMRNAPRTMCGDWAVADICQRWAPPIAADLCTFIWPLRSVDEVKRLLGLPCRPYNAFVCEFTAALRDEDERVHRWPAFSIDPRDSLTPGVHACLDARDVMPLAVFSRVYALPPCTHQTLSDTTSKEAKQLDGRTFWGIAFFIWCWCITCEMIMIEQPDTIIPDFYIRPSQRFRTSETGDLDDKQINLYERRRARLPLTSCAGGTSGHGQLGDFADAEERDRLRSSWLRFPLLVKAVIEAPYDPLDSSEQPDYAVEIERFAVAWYMSGLPLPCDYNNPDARPAAHEARVYQSRRGKGDGRRFDGAIPHSLRTKTPPSTVTAFEPQAVAAQTVVLTGLSVNAFALCFVAMQTIPLVFALLNGFEVIGAELRLPTHRKLSLAIATRWAEAAIGTASSTFLVGEYSGGGKLIASPLDLNPPARQVIRTPEERRRRLRAGVTMAWCTVAALVGTVAHDPVSRAVSACSALRGPIQHLADSPVFGHRALPSFTFGVFATRPMVDRMQGLPTASMPARTALEHDWANARLLSERLWTRGWPEDLLWADRIRPPELQDVPPEFFDNLPTFDDERLDSILLTPPFQPSPSVKLLPRPLQPSAPAGLCPRTPADLMPSTTERRWRTWMQRTLEDLVCIRDNGVDCERQRPGVLVIAQSELYAWARGIVWDFRRAPRNCAVPLAYDTPSRSTLNADYFRQELDTYPNQRILGMIETGVIYQADVELHAVFVPHLASLPKGFRAVDKELRRLRAKEWYEYFSHPPFWPLYCNGQGSQARKLEPDRDRRTTEGGGPRRDTWDRDKLKVLSINEASKTYHVPQHYIVDDRWEMRDWMHSRGLPPSLELLAALERQRGTKWGPQYMPSIKVVMHDLVVLKRAAFELNLPVYILGNDVADYFNHLTNAASELPLMNIAWIGQDELEADARQRAFSDQQGNHLVFVSELRMGFGIHPNSGIAQELSEAVDYIFRRKMDVRADAWLNHRDDAASRAWLAKRRALEKKHGGHQRRLYASHTYCDDNIIMVVGVPLALMAMEERGQIERDAHLIMAIPEKRILGTWGLWLGIYIFTGLGLIVVPKAKIARAVAALTQALQNELPFDEYQSLTGLLEHIRHASCWPRRFMHGLYRPHARTGESQYGPATKVRPDFFMANQLQGWIQRMLYTAGAVVTDVLRRMRSASSTRRPTKFVGSSDAATDSKPPGMAGYMHGLFWYLPLTADHIRWLHISVLELIASCISIITFHGPGCLPLVAELVLGADASATVTALTADSERSEMLIATHHSFENSPHFRRAALNTSVGHLRGDSNDAADFLSRDKRTEFAALCKRLKIRPRQLDVSRHCLDIVERVLQYAKARGRPVRPNPYVASEITIPPQYQAFLPQVGHKRKTIDSDDSEHNNLKPSRLRQSSTSAAELDPVVGPSSSTPSFQEVIQFMPTSSEAVNQAAWRAWSCRPLVFRDGSHWVLDENGTSRRACTECVESTLDPSANYGAIGYQASECENADLPTGPTCAFWSCSIGGPPCWGYGPPGMLQCPCDECSDSESLNFDPWSDLGSDDDDADPPQDPNGGQGGGGALLAGRLRGGGDVSPPLTNKARPLPNAADRGKHLSAVCAAARPAMSAVCEGVKGAPLDCILRKLAQSFQIEPKKSTYKAMEAVLSRLADMHSSDELAWEAHEAKQSNFYQWKQKLHATLPLVALPPSTYVHEWRLRGGISAMVAPSPILAVKVPNEQAILSRVLAERTAVGALLRLRTATPSSEKPTMAMLAGYLAVAAHSDEAIANQRRAAAELNERSAFKVPRLQRSLSPAEDHRGSTVPNTEDGDGPPSQPSSDSDVLLSEGLSEVDEGDEPTVLMRARYDARYDSDNAPFAGDEADLEFVRTGNAPLAERVGRALLCTCWLQVRAYIDQEDGALSYLDVMQATAEALYAQHVKAEKLKLRRINSTYSWAPPWPTPPVARRPMPLQTDLYGNTYSRDAPLRLELPWSLPLKCAPWPPPYVYTILMSIQRLTKCWSRANVEKERLQQIMNYNEAARPRQSYPGFDGPLSVFPEMSPVWFQSMNKRADDTYQEALLKWRDCKLDIKRYATECRSLCAHPDFANYSQDVRPPTICNIPFSVIEKECWDNWYHTQWLQSFPPYATISKGDETEILWDYPALTQHPPIMPQPRYEGKSLKVFGQLTLADELPQPGKWVGLFSQINLAIARVGVFASPKIYDGTMKRLQLFGATIVTDARLAHYLILDRECTPVTCIKGIDEMERSSWPMVVDQYWHSQSLEHQSLQDVDHCHPCDRPDKTTHMFEVELARTRSMRKRPIGAGYLLMVQKRGKCFRDNDCGDGPGRVAAALRIADSVAPPLLPRQISHDTKHVVVRRSKLWEATQMQRSITSNLAHALQTKEPDTALNAHAKHASAETSQMPVTMVNGQQFAAPAKNQVRRDRRVSKRKLAMLELAHDRAHQMADPNATPAQRANLVHAVVATHELAEHGAAIGTLDVDDHAFEFWDRFCKLYGFPTTFDAGYARAHPEQVSQRLAIFQAWVYPQLCGRGGRADAKPQTVFNNYVLAIMRVFTREHIPMPKSKHVEKNLAGLMRSFKEIYGVEVLMPGRKQPLLPSMWARIEALHEGASLNGRAAWSPSRRLRDRTLLRLGRVLWRTGHRMGEIVWHKSGEINFITRSCVSIRKKNGRVIHVPQAADWSALAPGDAVLLAPCASKSDQFGQEHCPFPSILPFNGDDMSAAASIRDIELEQPCLVSERRTCPLFGDETNAPFTYSVLHSELRKLLAALFGVQMASTFSWHSIRIGLACALHASGCPDPVIQLICRWASPDSLKVYRQVGIEKNIHYTDLAQGAVFDALRVNNLPCLDNDERMGQNIQAYTDAPATPQQTREAATPRETATPLRTSSFPIPGGSVEGISTDNNQLVGQLVAVYNNFWRGYEGDMRTTTCRVAACCAREFKHPDNVRCLTYLLQYGDLYYPIKYRALLDCLTQSQRRALPIPQRA
jgi:hypothetical protein